MQLASRQTDDLGAAGCSHPGRATTTTVRRRQLLATRPRDALDAGGCEMQLASRPRADLDAGCEM
jgi:hypothetical protein